jgi:hypothetical protein
MLQVYNEGFFISGRVSNNVFAWEKRRNRKLYVPALVEGFPKDVEAGDKTAFEDFDDEGRLKSCAGLKNFVKIADGGGRTVYVFDNHNHAFYFWHLERIAGRIKDGALLVHIDQHKDSRIPAKFLTPAESRDMKLVFEYTNTYLNVGNFIPPAQKTGLVGRIVNVDSEDSMNNFDFSLLENSNKITDLDMDFFAPELDYISFERKTAFAANCIKNSNVVTIATSPFFIDQGSAIRYLAKILSPP